MHFLPYFLKRMTLVLCTQDLSYYCCIEVIGSQQHLIDLLTRITSAEIGIIYLFLFVYAHTVVKLTAYTYCKASTIMYSFFH